MLVMVVFFIAFRWIHLSTPLIRLFLLVLILLLMPTLNFLRSEERRVGKECRYRRFHFHAIKNIRTLPTGSVDTNFGLLVRNRRQLTSFQNTCAYVYIMPISFHYK